MKTSESSAAAMVRALYASAALGTSVAFEDVLLGKYDELMVAAGAR